MQTELNSTAISILDEMKASGGRTTRVRTAVVGCFATSKAPMTASELLDLLASQKILANKTTIYREIANLVEKGILVEIHLGDRAVRYELKDEGHHHHVVCVRCDTVVDVDLYKDLDRHELAIAKKTKFTILRHSLEFFGVCSTCQ